MDKKKQHWLPKVWVKNYFLNKENYFENGERINISNHRYSNYFYNFVDDNIPNIDPLFIEDHFFKFENQLAISMPKIEAFSLRGQLIFLFLLSEHLLVRSPSKLITNKYLEELHKLTINKENTEEIKKKLIDINYWNERDMGLYWIRAFQLRRKVMAEEGWLSNSNHPFDKLLVRLKFPIDMPLPNESKIRIREFKKGKYGNLFKNEKLHRLYSLKILESEH